jgi:hypothetical protein
VLAIGMEVNGADASRVKAFEYRHGLQGVHVPDVNGWIPPNLACCHEILLRMMCQA